MKYLGLDYGAKRIGVAVSDESATLAFPLGVVAAGEKALWEVLDIIKENDAKFVVMGESLNKPEHIGRRLDIPLSGVSGVKSNVVDVEVGVGGS